MYFQEGEKINTNHPQPLKKKKKKTQIGRIKVSPFTLDTPGTV